MVLSDFIYIVDHRKRAPSISSRQHTMVWVGFTESMLHITFLLQTYIFDHKKKDCRRILYGKVLMPATENVMTCFILFLDFYSAVPLERTLFYMASIASRTICVRTDVDFAA
ncbi:hypothetical protein BDB00DRAFT_262444 [Zychaea mexicana]|uniref:uncharacterized protein n=1 Tax=Zychaea mexicana TaxID=64656 RepID=UPI0022FE6F3B|nr:uncharacterized protein BDB00DRAFT_262444 [Zychaea mexicana]KAI9469634.1 hypothetical protein BDB00DRAFT_262444 [Zychaea mexicana]